MNDAGLDSAQRLKLEPFQAAWSAIRRAFILTSAVLFAILISGGVFVFTPLVGLRIAHTSGTSMGPALKGGDVVLIKDVGEGDFQIGAVVVFEALGRQIIHRIIEERTGRNGEPLIVTQGDNVPSPDFPILASQMTGKLVGEVPILGPVSRMLDAEGGIYVYRSAVLTLAVTTVALWGITASVRGRRQPLARGAFLAGNNAGTSGEPQA